MTAAGDGPRAVTRSAAGMGAAAALSRGVGAVRVLVIAAVLGTTYLGNAFQGANTVSNVLFELLAAGALSAVLVPAFVTHLERGDRRGADLLAGRLLGVAVVVLGAVAVLGVALSPWIADLLTSAVDDPAVAEQQRSLTTVLLWFFIPQVVLYGLGAIATAMLHARRSFVVPALAPIGNTVVMVALLLVFRSVAGPDPGLDLDTTEVVILGLAGTLGVVAFVAAPTIAVWRDGSRLLPVFSRPDAELRGVLSQSGWASVQHAFAAVLLGAAIVAGGAVEGGVVAYQVGWFFFLAPYGIIAQPIHTAILPELVAEHRRGDLDAMVRSTRWALDSMTALLVPLSALCVALAVPAMSVLAFGQARTAGGVELLAAALASLGLGLLPYGAFLLLARVFYVLDDSRSAAVAGGVGAAVGVVVMAASALAFEGAATVAGLGVAHSVAFAVAAAVLVVRLRSRVGAWLVPTLLGRTLAISVPLGLALWWAHDLWSPTGRGGELLSLVVLVPVAVAVYAVAARLCGLSLDERLARGGGTP